MLFLSISRLDPPCSTLQLVDGLEIRLDLVPNWSLEKIRQIMEDLSLPVMLTLRRVPGETEGEWESKTLDLLQLGPAWIDLEYNGRSDFIIDAIQNFPKTKVILSYHNFERVPDDLTAIYESMLKFPAYGYKMALLTRSATEALSLFLFGRERKNLSVICMGEKGAFVRALGPLMGNQIDFACIDHEEKTAPGQLSAHELAEIYRYHQISPQTAIYGLIGSPVDHSRGHFYHNQVFSAENRDAIYVKMVIEVDELGSFFSLAKQLGFRGLSVTMPLKEKVLPFLDKLDEQVLGSQSANTLYFQKDQVCATNTDGKGALDVIEKKFLVQGKKVVLIGAGGVARAIGFEAIKRGAKLCIVNRTLKNAEKLAQFLGCDFQKLSHMPQEYDVLINCSASSPEIGDHSFFNGALVMDVIYQPRETAFLQVAKKEGCEIIYGDEMFKAQAKAQQRIWKKENLG